MWREGRKQLLCKWAVPREAVLRYYMCLDSRGQIDAPPNPSVFFIPLRMSELFFF